MERKLTKEQAEIVYQMYEEFGQLSAALLMRRLGIKYDFAKLIVREIRTVDDLVNATIENPNELEEKEEADSNE